MGNLSRCVIRGAVAAALLGVIGAVGVSSPAQGASPPSVSVTPSTGLVDAQTVTVSGTGLTPNTTGMVQMCPPGATDSFGCDGRAVGARFVGIDSSGTFTTQFSVIRFPRRLGDTTSPPQDCAVESCTIGVFEGLLTGSATFAPVTFANVPQISPTLHVVPASGLTDGQRVQLTGDGFRPNEAVSLSECPPGATAPGGCSSITPTSSQEVDSHGHLDTAMAADRFIRLEASTDCATPGCTIGVLSIGGFTKIPIRFATPTLSINVTPAATLDGGTGEVVAQATVSCDMATPVALVADITQPGVQGHYVLDRQLCTPTQPLHAFLSSRTLVLDEHPFALETADVTVAASPLQHFDAGDPSTVVVNAASPVQLIDNTQLIAAIQTALLDPANTELRDQVRQAIILRMAQDPVFRAAFIALLHVG